MADTTSRKDMFSVEGKVALVTGASRGLGQAMAIALANAGSTVICSSSSAGGTQKTRELIEENGGKAKELVADLSNREAVANLVHRSLELYGRIDILLNNGGTIARYPAVDFPIEEWDRVLEVNLTASFQLAKLCAPSMIANGGGKIINIASMLSYSGGITVPAYTASKHAVAGITKALANEWAQHNIQVNAIAPGYFRTDNTQKLQDDPVRDKEIKNRIPAQRWGNPSDLGGTAVFLASAASNYINGTIINVDGGWMAR
ncbi:MAG: 2-dehydro-3-deoxy-D-gluconate 5-dehydrogenase KduD [Bacteroidia bacterium]|nr:2-dehydro-3-deoxy-D-gluconate 5-dehydrogenase KduD [Bacteroidia bacterium]